MNTEDKNVTPELNYSELEDRLEMAQVAASEVKRCFIGDGGDSQAEALR